MSNDASNPGSPAPETARLPAASLSSLPARLWLILGHLRGAIAALGGRDRASVPLVLLAWRRVGRLAQRFEALVARLVAGTLPAPRVRVEARTDRPRPVDGLPRGFAWLVRVLPEAASFGCQLQALLEDPAMAALLASCRQAGRIIRPLKHMLGVVDPGTPVRVSRVRPAWWQAVPAVCAAAPAGPVPFPTGRPPPSWFR